MGLDIRLKLGSAESRVRRDNSRKVSESKSSRSRSSEMISHVITGSTETTSRTPVIRSRNVGMFHG